MTQVDYVLHGPMPTLGFDAKGRVLACNQAWVFFTGVHEEHWLQLTWDTMQAADELIAWPSMLQQSGYEGQRIYLQPNQGRSLPCLVNLFKHPQPGHVVYVATAQGLASLIREFDQDVYGAYEQGRHASEEDLTHRLGNTFTSLNQHTDTLAKQAKILRKMSTGLEQTAKEMGADIDAKKLVKMQFVVSRASSILADVTNSGMIEPVKRMRTQLAQVQREVSNKPAFASGSNAKHQQFLLLPLLHDCIDAKVFAKVTLGIDCDADLEIQGVSRNLLIQVIKHIINNSLEAIQMNIEDTQTTTNKQGHIKISVRLERLEQVTWLNLSIDDDGCGIGTAQVSNILAAGYTTKAGHSGNGLHWVANYLQSLGGSIHISPVASQKGTRVAITLPMDAG